MANETMTEPVTVFLVDDHAIVREGLAAILSREPDFAVVGEAADAEEALGLMEEIQPAVAVLDQRLPGMSGLELCREIAERRMRTQVVILSGFLERHAVEGALRAGARAFVVKDVEADELKRAIRAAAQGQTTIDPKLSRVFAMDRQEKRMSPRHLRILNALGEGLSAAEIGQKLGLTEHTVKSYMRELYAELEVNSRAEAIAAAARRGLL